jgi:hypothetical protein
VFYLHGAFISQKLRLNQQGIDKLFVNLSLGFSVVVFLLFFIALLHLLYPSFVSIFFLIIPVYYLATLIKQKQLNIDLPIFAQGLINYVWLIFIILYLVLPDTYNLFFPETRSDAIRYHLPYARFYVENHGLAVNEFLRYPVFSHNMDMSFTLGYLFLGDDQGEVLARMFSLFAFFVVILGLYSLAQRSFSKITAIIAVIILVKAKIFRTMMISGYIDIGLTLFLFVSIYFLYLWSEQKKDKYLYLSACMLGIVLGTKYLGLLWWIPLTFWVFFTNKNWKNTYQYFVIALLVGSPWYIRNIFIAGNPLHPFLQDVFGYWLWTPEDVIGQKTDLLVRRGIDRTLLNFIKFPYLLETHPYFSKFHWGWFMALGIPFLGFALNMHKFFKMLSIFVLFNLIFWFFTSQIDRYLMPTLPLLALFSAYPFGQLFNFITKIKWLNNKFVAVFVALVLYGYGGYKITHKFKVLDKWKPLEHNSTDWQKANFKNDKYYQFSHQLNQLHVKRVFNLSNAMLQNTFKGMVLGDWYGIASKRLIYKQCHNAQDVEKTLISLDTYYLLVSKKNVWFNNVNKWVAKNPNFKILKESNEAVLYHLNMPKSLHKDH